MTMRVILKRYEDLPNIAAQHAYVDESASLRNTAWLLESGDFDYAAFTELCNFLEAIVLYDRLYTCPLSQIVNPPSVILRSPSVTALVAEDVLTFLEPPTELLFEDAPQTPQSEAYRRGMRVFEEGKRAGVIHVEYIYGVGMATVHGMHVHPSISNRRGYSELMRIPESVEATAALLEAYRGMSKAFNADVEKVMRARGQLFVPIPPIPLEILKRVSRPSEILEEALYFRRRLKSIRRAYEHYANTLSDANLPINKSLSALAKLERVLGELSAPFGEKEKRQIIEWTSVGELAQATPEVMSGDPSGLIQVILGKPLEWVCYWLRRRRFLQLYRLKRSALRSSGYHRHIDRLWGKAVEYATPPPTNLDEFVDYPRGSDWLLYGGDDICLWSWSGRWIGYRKGDNVFSTDHRHIGRFMGQEIFARDGRYLGEWQYGRLVVNPRKAGRTVPPVDKVEPEGGLPVDRRPLERRELPSTWEDFPEQ